MSPKVLRKFNMSTPTTLPGNAGVTGKGCPKRKVDELDGISPTPQLKAQDQPFKGTNAAKFKRIKLAAVSKKFCGSTHWYLT